MGEWLQLKKSGKRVGKIGSLSSKICEWTLGYSMTGNSKEFDASQASHIAYAQAVLLEESRLQLSQSLGRSRPLERRSLWNMKSTSSNPKGAKK